jgi:hypothetical protein
MRVHFAHNRHVLLARKGEKGMGKTAEVTMMAGFVLFAAGAIVPGFTEPLALAIGIDNVAARMLSVVLCMTSLGVLTLGRVGCGGRQ